MRDSYLVENTAMSSNNGRLLRCCIAFGRESHWQSPVPRNDRHKTCNARGICSLSVQFAQLRPL